MKFSHFIHTLCCALGILLTSISGQADTMDHYMNIINGIPQMEIKADEQSQAWARSARSVILLTCDGIADTLLLANELAKKSGQQPLFCLTQPGQMSPEALSELIQQTYKTLPRVQAEKEKMTVSEVALLAVQERFPCTAVAQMTQITPPPTTWKPN